MRESAVSIKGRTVRSRMYGAAGKMYGERKSGGNDAGGRYGKRIRGMVFFLPESMVFLLGRAASALPGAQSAVITGDDAAPKVWQKYGKMSWYGFLKGKYHTLCHMRNPLFSRVC